MALNREGMFRALAIVGCALCAQTALALEGGEKSPHGHFRVVGSFALDRSSIGSGFSGVQIAPKWVLTAAHAAPPVGAIFVDDCGMAGVAEVLTFPMKVPAQTPLPGALHDDLALVRLAAPVPCPYFPRLAEDSALPPPGIFVAIGQSGGGATLVSNSPSMAAQRFGFARVEGVFRAPGYDFVVVASKEVALIAGDSGSPLFLGRVADTDRESVVAGVATGQTRNGAGLALGVYTRVGPYRPLLDTAVEASGERLRWSTEAPRASLVSRNASQDATR